MKKLDLSKIGWTGFTWNPWQGCEKKSPGCKNCYMHRDKKRYGQEPSIVVRSAPGTFNKPLKIQREIDRGERAGNDRLCFTCSWSDFFNPEASEWLPDAWEVIRKTPGIVYQILTKLPQNIAGNLPPFWDEIKHRVWLGVSLENSDYLWRLKYLTQISAAVRFVSVEPLLGSVLTGSDGDKLANYTRGSLDCPYPINWLIGGGESGLFVGQREPFAARPMPPFAIRELIDFATDQGIPIFFKQWGDWAIFDYANPLHKKHGLVYCAISNTPGEQILYFERPPYAPLRGWVHMVRLGTRINGELSNGEAGNGLFSQDYKQMPKLAAYQPKGENQDVKSR